MNEVSLIQGNKDAYIHCILGATGTGKSTYTLGLINRIKPTRLIVMDTKFEYDLPSFTDTNRLHEALTKYQSKVFRVAFRPDRGNRDKLERQFDFICLLARHFAKGHGKTLFVVEELHRLTTASHAPAQWKDLTCTSRSEGLMIIGTSQRPAHMDKDFIGNASHVTSFRLGFKTDAATVSESLPGITRDNLLNLPNFTGYHCQIGQAVQQISSR